MFQHCFIGLSCLLIFLFPNIYVWQPFIVRIAILTHCNSVAFVVGYSDIIVTAPLTHCNYVAFVVRRLPLVSSSPSHLVFGATPPDNCSLRTKPVTLVHHLILWCIVLWCPCLYLLDFCGALFQMRTCFVLCVLFCNHLRYFLLVI